MTPVARSVAKKCSPSSGQDFLTLSGGAEGSTNSELLLVGSPERCLDSGLWHNVPLVRAAARWELLEGGEGERRERDIIATVSLLQGCWQQAMKARAAAREPATLETTELEPTWLLRVPTSWPC